MASTLVSVEAAYTRRQAPSSDHSHHPAITVGRKVSSQQPGTIGLVTEVRRVCTEAQKTLQALNQAVHTVPGIPGRIADLIGNDLSSVAHHFITINSLCYALEKKVNEEKLEDGPEIIAQPSSPEVYQEGPHEQIPKTNMPIYPFQKGFEQLVKHSKDELEAKVQKLSQKVNNQKKRINEQEAQIETLKLKLRQGDKLDMLTIKDNRDVNSFLTEIPHSATSELLYRNCRRPPVLQPMMGHDRQFPLNDLRCNIDGAKSFMDRSNHLQGGPAPAASLFGQFGYQLPGAIRPHNAMNCASAYYGLYPLALPHGQYKSGSTRKPSVRHHTSGLVPLSAPLAFITALKKYHRRLYGFHGAKYYTHAICSE